MRITKIEDGYRFTVKIAGEKHSYITTTIAEGEKIATLMLGGAC